MTVYTTIQYPQDIYTATIKNTSGSIIGVFDSFSTITISRTFNDVGTCIIEVDQSHPILDDLSLDYRIEVLSDITNVLFSGKTFIGVYRGNNITFGSDGRKLYTLYFTDLFSVLQRQIVAYTSDTANRSTWTSTLTTSIMSDIIRYNCVNGQDSGRETAILQDILTVTISPTPSVNSIDFNCAWRNAYDVIKELLKTESSHRITFLQNGTKYDTLIAASPSIYAIRDLTERFVFDFDEGNSYNVNVDRTDTNRTTGVLVGDSNSGSARNTVYRTNSDHSGVNAFESFIDAFNTDVTSELNAIGDAEVNNNLIIKKEQFTPIFRTSLIPFRDITEGDLVTTIFSGTKETKRVKTIIMDVSGKERVFTMLLEEE